MGFAGLGQKIWFKLQMSVTPVLIELQKWESDIAHPEKKIARHWKFKVWNFLCENVFIYFFGHEKIIGFTWNWQDSCKI